MPHPPLPASSAAYEMEININDVGMAVLKYLDTGDLEYRRLMEEEHAAFEGFHAEYLRLGKTEKEKELGRAIASHTQRRPRFALGLIHKL